MSEVTLQAYFERIVHELDVRIDTRLRDLEVRIDERFAALSKSMDVAESMAEKWRYNANEWRSAMSERERSFLPRSEYTLAHNALYEMVASVQTLITKEDGKSTGYSNGFVYLLGLVSLISTIGSAIAFMLHIK